MHKTNIITSRDGDKGSIIFTNYLNNHFYRVSKRRVNNFKPWDLIDMFNGVMPNPETFIRVTLPEFTSDERITYYKPDEASPEKIDFIIHREERLAMLIPYCKYCKSRPTALYRDNDSEFLVCDKHDAELTKSLSRIKN